LLLVSILLFAGETAFGTAPKTSKPIQVEVGAYLVDVYDLDLKSSSFNADFYLWMRWHGDINPGKFEAMNGQMQFIGDPDEKDQGDFHYRCWRCNGKFRALMDFHSYPTDNHVLEILLEDGSHDKRELVYVPDIENLAQSPGFYLGAWEQGGPITAKAITFKYTTNYGNPTRSKGEVAEYSRFILSIPVRHAGGSSLIYAKTFLGLFISVAIALLAFLIDPTDLDPRFGVGVAAIFGAVSSMLVVSSNMPENPYFSLSDKIHIFSLLFIFLTLFISCISLRLKKMGYNKVSFRVDMYAGISCTLLYIAGVSLLSICFR